MSIGALRRWQAGAVARRSRPPRRSPARRLPRAFTSGAGAATAAVRIGRDLPRPVPASGAGARSWLPLLLAAVVIAALGLSALRSDRIRLRYDLAQALAQERELLERERLLIVEVRKLRSPARLASFARTLGLSPPQRVVELSAQTAAR